MYIHVQCTCDCVLPSVLSQAYFFEDDSDEHSGSDVSPLVRRPASQSVNNAPHAHILTGYLSIVEVLVLVSLQEGRDI